MRLLFFPHKNQRRSVPVWLKIKAGLWIHFTTHWCRCRWKPVHSFMNINENMFCDFRQPSIVIKNTLTVLKRRWGEALQKAFHIQLTLFGVLLWNYPVLSVKGASLTSSCWAVGWQRMVFTHPSMAAPAPLLLNSFNLWLQFKALPVTLNCLPGCNLPCHLPAPIAQAPSSSLPRLTAPRPASAFQTDSPPPQALLRCEPALEGWRYKSCRAQKDH